MRIGIYLPKILSEYSIDFVGCARALLDEGHQPVMICPGSEIPFPGEVAVYTAREETTPKFWRALNLDRAIFYNWFRNPDVLAAAHAAGVYIITRADSDGLVSTKVFPKAGHRRLVDPARGPIDFLKRWRHFLNWHFFHWRSHDKEVIEVIELSDRIAVETGAALENFRIFLKFHKRENLVDRFEVVSHAVPDSFLDFPVETGDRKNIFCGGRWGDDQKNARLLEQTIPKILESLPVGEILIAGSGVSPFFDAVAKRFPRVRVLGFVDRSKLPDILSGCRYLLSSSRWESHPIGALEALCCGCTVVSTPMPGFSTIVDSGNFGTLSKKHSPEALAAAAIAEARYWDKGERNPALIASHWRARVSNKVVTNQLLKL